MSGKGMRIVVAFAFVALAGSAFAATEQDVTLTVTIRSLGVSVTPGTYNFGIMNLGEYKICQDSLTVANTGNDTQDIGIRVRDEDDQDEWTLGTEAGANVYALGAHFAAGDPGGTRLTTSVQWADGVEFGGGGNDMASAATVPLGFGFDAPTGIDLPGERSGTLPRADVAGGIHPTTLALLGIGQGPIAVTPLQVARGFAALAVDGPVMRPHVARLKPRVSSVFALSPHVREAVVKGLKGVVHDPDGTAHGAFHEPPLPGERSFAGEFPGVEVAGKTGTAERSGRPPNAWFAGFAPVEEPEIAFAVVIEGGGHGGDTAAPAAARMLGAYFRLISLPRGTEGQGPSLSSAPGGFVGSRTVAEQ